MIGIDTTILVRAYLEDNQEQAIAAQEFLSKATDKRKLFISSYAILEFVWVLKTKKFARKSIYEAVMALINSEGVIIGQRIVIINAIAKYIKGKADFGDYMILAEGELNNSYSIKTFDQEFLKELKGLS